jgi:hypothetical protein
VALLGRQTVNGRPRFNLNPRLPDFVRKQLM